MLFKNLIAFSLKSLFC